MKFHPIPLSKREAGRDSMFDSHEETKPLANVRYNQLSVRKVQALLKGPRSKTGDGNSLWLRCDGKGNGHWVCVVTFNGLRRELGGGSAREVSLAEAREWRDKVRRQVRDGVDPLSEKRRRAETPTFEQYARDLYDQIKHEWRNEKHSASWIRSLEQYAFPKLGRMPVDKIDAPAITNALAPIWQSKGETARRTKQRIARILDAAIASDLRPGPNPAAAVGAALGKKRKKAEHLAAMPYADVPAFYARLDASEMAPASKAAFQFLILTAGRTSEILNATWGEVDLRKRVWTVPPDRMKAGEEHKVPLSDEAARVLKSVRAYTGKDGFVFAKSPGKPFSNMVFLTALKRMNEPVTAHGFRSAFRDWAEEQTAYPHAAMEAALAHKVADKVEAAYRRTKLFEKRKSMMDEWAKFVAQAPDE